MIIILFSALFSAEIFDLPSSAYPASMGTFSATNKGIHSIWYNPAGIFTNSIGGTHNRVFNLYNFNFIGCSYTKKKFAISMSIGSLTIDSIPEFGEDIPDTPKSYFKDNQIVITTGVAYKCARYKTSLGMNIKYLTHSLYNKKGTGIGIDIGINYKYKNLVIAAIFKDIGHTRIKWENKEDKRKMITILGINYSIKNFMIATELGYQEYQDDLLDNIIYSIGAEYSVENILFLRAGFLNHITCGVGIRIRKFNFDYALKTHKDLPLSHIFTASFIP